MDLTEANKVVKRVLSDKRYAHTIRVVETAEVLVQSFGGNQESIKLAAMLHDYAKCFSEEELKKYINKYQLPATLLDYHHELWHGPVAAAIMEHEYGIRDKDILNAIYHHTTGRAGMTILEYIIFVADYIEPGRSFPGVDSVRDWAKTDLIHAAKVANKNTIIFLMEKNNTVHPNSFNMYNMLVNKEKERSIVDKN